MISLLTSLSSVNPPLPCESVETSELHSFLEGLRRDVNLVSLFPFFFGLLAMIVIHV